MAISSDFNGFKPATIKYYLDHHTIRTLKTLIAWPRIKNLIMMSDKKEDEEFGLFGAKLRPTCGEMKQLKHVLPKIHGPKNKDLNLISVH